jgi:nitroreductase
MDVFEALYTTRAMRRVRADPIPLDVQASILDAAIRAPNGGNGQRWRFLLVDDPNLRASIGEVYRVAFRRLMDTMYAAPIEHMRRAPEAPSSVALAKLVRSGQHLADHFEQVPLVLFAFVQHDTTGQSIYPALWSAMLAARVHGVGSALTTVLAMFAAERTLQLLGVPTDAGWSNPGAVTFGYPLGPWRRAERHSIEDVAYRNRWAVPADLGVDRPLWP